MVSFTCTVIVSVLLVVVLEALAALGIRLVADSAEPLRYQLVVAYAPPVAPWPGPKGGIDRTLYYLKPCYIAPQRTCAHA